MLKLSKLRFLWLFVLSPVQFFSLSTHTFAEEALQSGSFQTNKSITNKFTKLTEIKVGKAPHGIRFHNEKIYIAMAGDDEIWVLDGKSYKLLDKWPVKGAPLDLVRLDEGWLVAPFSQNYLIELSEQGKTGKSWPVAKGPSLFTPYQNGTLTYIVNEFEDKLTVFDTHLKTVINSIDTGDRPYPADVIAKNNRAFVPNRDEDTVSVIDLNQGKHLTKVKTCDKPEGGALTMDSKTYMVTCSGDNKVLFIDTKSYQVTATISKGIESRPFAVTAGEDGRFAYVNNAGGTKISVIDIPAKKVVHQLDVGQQPIVMRVYNDLLLVTSEVSNTLSAFTIPGKP